nr:MAG: hypothetical protein [Bacteriophage sp.]
MRGRLVTAQAARAGVPLVIVGAAACRAAVPAAGVPPGGWCLGVGGVRLVVLWAGAGVWCWLAFCCPVLLVVGGLLAGGLLVWIVGKRKALAGGELAGAFVLICFIFLHRRRTGRWAGRRAPCVPGQLAIYNLAGFARHFLRRLLFLPPPALVGEY